MVNTIGYNNVGDMLNSRKEYKYALRLSSSSNLSIWEDVGLPWPYNESDDIDNPKKRLLYLRSDVEKWLIDSFGEDGDLWTINRIDYHNPLVMFMKSEVASAFKLRWL